MVFLNTNILPSSMNPISLQLLYLAKLCDLPDLQKQLDASPLGHQDKMLEASMAEAKPVLNPSASSMVHSGHSSPMVSSSSASPAMLMNPLMAGVMPFGAGFAPQLNPALCAAYLQLIQQQQATQGLNNLIQASLAAAANQAAVAQQLQQASNPNTSSIFPRFDAIPQTLDKINHNRSKEARISESEQLETRSVASSSCSSAHQPTTAPSPPFDNLGDLLVPSNDKEGWCRNKKYIQTVPNGYRCTVCNKVYGRYNSVSYHVTIYHRNPPIRCEEPGCQFTTREARYIYFHKYYRHGVALPESIDTASRKCPFFSCRHVSKSPAMLDKHLSRHICECLRDGQYHCPNCEFQTMESREMLEHLRAHHFGAMEESRASGKRPAPGPSHNVFPCDQCSYKGRTATNLEHHRASKHGRSAPISLPRIHDENLKTSENPLPLPSSSSFDAAALNLSALKALIPEHLFAVFSSASVSANQ